MAWWLLLACPLWAQTFHVATDGSNTTGDGSVLDPWATIEHALGEVPDGSLILVAPGRYDGRIRLDDQFTAGVVVRSEVPYLAQLRHTQTVLTCFTGIGITIEGFDIAHAGPGAGPLVIQVQDLIGSPGGVDAVSRIVFRNNIIHDSYNNDLLKINNGAREVLVEGNLFYNQLGHDEHMDINGVVDVEVRGNIFFNDYAGSGRPNNNDTGSYIVVKNSGGLALNEQFYIHRNIFLNWEGSSGSNMILFGEDAQSFYEARDALVENNLLLGNSPNNMRAAFGVKGCREIRFRNNTVAGDLPALAFAMRLNREGANPANDEIAFHNQIWSDPGGSMGATFSNNNDDFSDTPPGDTLTFIFDHNLFWNGGNAVPEDPGELINPSDDVSAVIGDPDLPDQTGIVLPRWDDIAEGFISGNASIQEEFIRLAQYGQPGSLSAAIDAADPAESPELDLLGQVRGPAPDLGAIESNPCDLGPDLDGDLDVDSDDLQMMAQQWVIAAGLPLDQDGDGRVTVLDLLLLLAAFGDCET